MIDCYHGHDAVVRRSLNEPVTWAVCCEDDGCEFGWHGARAVWNAESEEAAVGAWVEAVLDLTCAALAAEADAW